MRPARAMDGGGGGCARGRGRTAVGCSFGDVCHCTPPSRRHAHCTLRNRVALARVRPCDEAVVWAQANEFDRKEAVDKEPIWRVLLHNDDVHTFDYVIDTIVSVVRTVTRKKAHRITMEAHKSGLATVTTTWKQLAREYSLGLQKAGLTSSIAPDKSNSC